MRKSGFLLSLAAVALLLPGLALAQGNPNARPGSPVEPTYEIITDYAVEITLRDGTIVRADIHRPDAEGQFPVLIEGTPYGKQTSTDMILETHSYFVPRGYVFMAYDVRGKNTSDGDFDNMHVGDQNDGYDIVEWAAKQPWSNGKVGLVGNSYGGQVVMHTAAANPPSLVCAAPMLTARDLWQEWYYRGGAMEYGFSTYWAGATFSRDIAQRVLNEESGLTDFMDTLALYAADPESFATVIPTTDFEPSAINDQWNLYKEWALHPTEDAYWLNKSPGTYYNNISVPLLHIGGWYDIFLGGTLKAYRDLQSQAGTELARKNQRLFVGPWYHQGMGFQGSVWGDHDFGPNLINPTFNEFRIAFFDYWMKDLQTELYQVETPVRYFTIGENQWHWASDWPLPGTEFVNYYLNGGKSGSVASINDNTLSTNPPAADQAPATYVYDPMDPIPTRGGSHLFTFAYGPDGTSVQGIQEQTPVDKRSLTFTSAPLEADLEITGPVKAVLYAASSAVDTDWVVRVNEVKPDGTSWNIVEGIQRARFRDSKTDPTLIEPGKIYEYVVDLWATSYVVPKGSCLRVVVNSSNFPRWSRNMNVAEFPEQATDWAVADNTIYFDAEHPSHVILPVMPK